MEKNIKVNLKERSYPIYIGSSIAERTAALLPERLRDLPVLIVASKNVMNLAGARLMKGLRPLKGGIDVEYIPDSEKAKSFKIYAKIISALSTVGKRKKPLVVALGGGVTGDVAGFAASTYRRGIPYIQVPTTLLAQVDSSIGGKTAIDLPHAKNLVGSFYQPSAVISDIIFLDTLPQKEIRNGLAEIIKYGIISGHQFFTYLEKNLNRILKKDRDVLAYTISKCAEIKARLVEKDEFDATGERMALNLGHTFAHGIETAFSYSKSYTHGEAVGVGLVMSSCLAHKLGMMSLEDSVRIRDIVARAGLPIGIKPGCCKKILDAMTYDKKFSGGKNRFVLPAKIGDIKIVENISEAKIINIIKKR